MMTTLKGLNHFQVQLKPLGWQKFWMLLADDGYRCQLGLGLIAMKTITYANGFQSTYPIYLY